MRVSLEVLLGATVKATGVPADEIVGRSRLVSKVFARQAFMFAACVTYGHSKNSVAKFLERDHSTVISGAARFSHRRRHCEEPRAVLARIRAHVAATMPQPDRGAIERLRALHLGVAA